MFENREMLQSTAATGYYKGKKLLSEWAGGIASKQASQAATFPERVITEKSRTILNSYVASVDAGGG